MQANLVRDLRAQRARIRARWEDLLRLEGTSSPLANPDILVHLFETTLDELFGVLETANGARRPLGAFDCPCGRNPFLGYFAAGRQAVREALVVSQAATPVLPPAERDSAWEELEGAYDRIARRQIESFCAVCQFRRVSDGVHPFAAASLQAVGRTG